jgi:hypothetical protein
MTCPGSLTSRLAAGEQARVLVGGVPNRLRDQPSVSGIQLALMPPGAIFDVLEGPECDPDGLAWWRVSYRNTVGWTVEGQAGEYFTEPLIDSETPTTTPPTPSRTPFSTNTPRVTAPAATQAGVTCPGFMPSRLVVGGQGRVTPGEPNNVRDVPSAGGRLVGQIDGGESFDVLEGPECDPDGRAWWRVQYGDIAGWTPEGQGNLYFVEPVGDAAISPDAMSLLTPDSP